MYYENFKELCDIRNVKPNDVSKATGIATSTLTNWKKGTYTPKQDKLQIIADYFGVSVDYIMTGNEYDPYSQESASLVAKIRNDKELSKRLLKYFSSNEETRRKVLEIMNVVMGD